MVKWLRYWTHYQRVGGSSLTSSMMLCPWARHSTPLRFSPPRSEWVPGRVMVTIYVLHQCDICTLKYLNEDQRLMLLNGRSDPVTRVIIVMRS